MTSEFKNPGELKGKIIAIIFFALINLALFIKVYIKINILNNTSLVLVEQEFKIGKDVYFSLL